MVFATGSRASGGTPDRPGTAALCASKRFTSRDRHGPARATGPCVRRLLAQERGRVERVAVHTECCSAGAASARAAQTGGDDGDPELARQPVVDRRAEDDV